MTKKKRPDNSTNVPLFSPELKETVRRLKQKESELDDVLKREPREPKKKRTKAQLTPSADSTPFAGRSGPLVRQWTIIRHISQNPGGVEAQELSRILNTARRTIYRDLVALKRAGFPLMRHKDEGGLSVWTIGAWWKDDFREESGENQAKIPRKS